MNTTPVHGHTALFGVYGMLGIGLTLLVLLSLLPVGLMQTWASVEHGLWYARSAEFLPTDSMNILRWLRVVGDTIFALGIMALGVFVIGLKTGWSVSQEQDLLLDRPAAEALGAASD